MDIYVMDGLSGVIGIVQTFQSVIWNMQFYGSGDFQLIVPGTAANVDLLQPGRLLVRDVDRGDGEYHNVMKIQDRKYSYDIEQGWILEVSGPGLKRIVGQRVVWEQTNISGTVEDGIRQVLTDNIISPDDSARAISNFILADAAGITDTIETQLFGENIADWLESISQTYGFGWDVYIKNGKYVFALVKGTDRTYNQAAVDPVVFSPDFDNLVSASYERSMTDYMNAALVGGEGEGTDQVITSVGSASGEDRYEGYIDGGSVSSNGEIITMETYLAMLQEYGLEQMTGTQYVNKFTGETIQNGMYVLNRDYFLGDLVQIDLNAFRAATRIIEIIYAEDMNGTSLIPTFSEWEVNE